MSQLLDYHVGLLRGFVLAHNAPTQILHALDVLLTDYRSKAGPVIGSDAIDQKMPPEPPMPRAPREHDPFVVETKEPEKKKFFWDSQDDEILERMYCLEGKKTKVIANELGRTPASVSTRISVRGLTRGVA